MSLIVVYVHPPIPMRECDWQAYDEDDPEGARGYGATREQALEDYLEQVGPAKCAECDGQGSFTRYETRDYGKDVGSEYGLFHNQCEHCDGTGEVLS
jgi:DnaJ-class molecular chaperone